MEIMLANKNSLPRLDTWSKILNSKLCEMQEGKKDIIMITFKNHETTTGLETAWRKICKNKHKTGHFKTKRHELGVTVYLWWD